MEKFGVLFLTYSSRKCFCEEAIQRCNRFSCLFTFGYLVWMGDALEHAWGAFRVTLFYFLGMVGVTIAAFLFGGGGLFAFLLNLSLFFAFATLYPDVQIYVLFVLPLKVKWLALVSLAPIILELLLGFLEHKSRDPDFFPQLFRFLRTHDLFETADANRN